MRKPKALGIGETNVAPVLSVENQVKTTSVKRKKETSKDTSQKKTVKKTDETKPTPVKKTPHKTNPTSVLGKSVVITESDALSKKLEIVNNISARKEKSETQNQYIKVGTPSLDEFKTRIHLALKTHSNHATLASNIARYAGTALVVLGGFFTVFGMSTIGIPLSTQNLAQVPCLDPTRCLPPGTSTTTHSQPVPTFTIEPAGTVLKGSVTVSITVPDALSVHLIAVDTKTRMQTIVGILGKQTDLLWQVPWNTNTIYDSTYTLTTLVITKTGFSYTFPDTTVYSVENHPVNETLNNATQSGTQSTATGNTSSTTSNTSSSGQGNGAAQSVNTNTVSVTSSTNATPISVTLSEPDPLYDSMVLTTAVRGGVSVRHYYKPSSSATTYALLGNASYSGNNAWEFVINSRIFDANTYDIRTQVFFPDGTNTYVTNAELELKPISDVGVPTTDNAPSTNNTSSVSQTGSLTQTGTQSTTNTTTTGSMYSGQSRGQTSTSLNPTEPVSIFTEQSLIPESEIRIPVSGTLSNSIEVFVDVPDASYVELYVLPNTTLVPRYIGQATRIDERVWKYTFKTTNVPNGSYMLYATIGTAYGETETDTTPITIHNVTTSPVTPDSQALLDTYKNIGDEIVSIEGSSTSSFDLSIIFDDPYFSGFSPLSGSTTSSSSISSPTSLSTQEDIPTSSTTLATAPHPDSAETKQIVIDIVDAYISELNTVMGEYAQAVRESDSVTTYDILRKLEVSRDDLLLPLTNDPAKQHILSLLKDYLTNITTQKRQYIERSETIIRERIGQAVFDDTDKDGITDYDEVNIFNTDPFRADTDGDGFVDGVEVRKGYDPLDSVPESLVAFESPQSFGIIRDDLLRVEHVMALPSADPSQPPRLYASGRALPNSYASLYIFSTPTIVTVRTDQNGAWSYIFEKELEDGEHEMYVAMTDNAGHIVARSKSYRFIKTANAFTPIDAVGGAPFTVTTEKPSLLSSAAALVIGSLAIVALGLVLILLGLHVRPREEQPQPA